MGMGGDVEGEGVVGSFGGGFEGREEKGLTPGREARIAIQGELSLLDKVFVERGSFKLNSFSGFSVALSTPVRWIFFSSLNDAAH